MLSNILASFFNCHLVFNAHALANSIFSRIPQELTKEDYQEQLEKNNAYNRQIFNYIHNRAMDGDGALLSCTDAYRRYDYCRYCWNGRSKSYILSPWTVLNGIDIVVRQVLKAQMELDKKK